jgi:hypothetical protein
MANRTSVTDDPATTVGPRTRGRRAVGRAAQPTTCASWRPPQGIGRGRVEAVIDLVGLREEAAIGTVIPLR